MRVVQRFIGMLCLTGILVFLSIPIASFAGGDDPPAETGFKVFPVLQIAATDSIGLAWETHNAATADIVISMNPDLSGAITIQIATSAKNHKITVNELYENTTYYYKVISDGETSRTGSFLTALAKGSVEPFRFVVYGDTRVSPWYEDAVSWYGDNEDHLAVCDSMMEYSPDFSVHVGDFVFDGTEMDGIYNFFDVEKVILSETPVYPIYGNHEFKGGSGANNTKMDNYIMSANGGNFGYYSVDYGNLHVLAINTGVGVYATDDFSVIAPGSPQYDFVLADLAAASSDSDIDHIIVALHAPLYSVAGFGDNQKLIDSLEPLLKQYGVKAVLMGHEHDYQRQEKDGIQYILSGGGGSSIMDMAWHGDEGDSAANLIKYDDVLNYVIIDVAGDTITCEARKVEGHGDSTSSLIETFSL